MRRAFRRPTERLAPASGSSAYLPRQFRVAAQQLLAQLFLVEDVDQRRLQVLGGAGNQDFNLSGEIRPRRDDWRQQNIRLATRAPVR
jgi:hypothetical protein